jgi:hypothetical protein
LRTDHFVKRIRRGATLAKDRSGGGADIGLHGHGQSFSNIDNRFLSQANSRMTAASEYRGVSYSVANNDDGVWRWIIYPKKSRRSELRVVPPRPTYETRDAAVDAAKAAIDQLLDGKSDKRMAPNLRA